MKVLIIGSKGNLGQQLMKVFSDYNVIGWDVDEIDITREKIVERKLKKLEPEVVINAAAYNAVDKCEADEREFALARKINGLGPGYLARVCAEIGVVLVHYSTDYVFGGKKKQGYKEDEKPEPINNYGRSKLLGEEEIKKQGGKFFIIRTSKLFGPPGEILGAKKSFIDIMLELSEKQEEIEVVDAEESCFTYTYDLARKTREILEAGARKYDYGIYHLVNQGPCTWFECARKLFEITGKTVKIKPVPAEKIKRPAKRPRYSALINSRGPKLRHWEAAAREYLSKIS